MDALGQPIADADPIDVTERHRIEPKIIGISSHHSIRGAIHIGLRAVGDFISVGHGRSEVTIGDRQIGKTAILVDAISNQKSTGVAENAEERLFCLHIAGDRRRSTTCCVDDIVIEYGHLGFATILAAFTLDSAPSQSVVFCLDNAVVECSHDDGRHAVIFFDDSSKQSESCRQRHLQLLRLSATIRILMAGKIMNSACWLIDVLVPSRITASSHSRRGGVLTDVNARRDNDDVGSSGSGSGQHSGGGSYGIGNRGSITRRDIQHATQPKAGHHYGKDAQVKRVHRAQRIDMSIITLLSERSKRRTLHQHRRERKRRERIKAMNEQNAHKSYTCNHMHQARAQHECKCSRTRQTR